MSLKWLWSSNNTLLHNTNNEIIILWIYRFVWMNKFRRNMLNSFFVGQKCPKYLSSSDEKLFSRWFVFEFHFKCLSKPFQIQIGSSLYPYFFDHVCVVYRYTISGSVSNKVSHTYVFFFSNEDGYEHKIGNYYSPKKYSGCERWTNVSSIHAPRTRPLLVYNFVLKMFVFVISTHWSLSPTNYYFIFIHTYVYHHRKCHWFWLIFL